VLLKVETDGVVERIRLWLARFPEDEETVRRLVATDPSFDALCHEYLEVMELLHGFERRNYNAGFGFVRSTRVVAPS
jgi:hypothetical protein